VRGGGVGRITPWGGSIVEWGSGSRVEGSGEGYRGVSWGPRLRIPRGVARGYLAIEGGEAGVVAVGGQAKAVGRGGRGYVA